MLSKVKSCGLLGIDGYIVEVETDISSTMPSFDIVGLPDNAIRESKERVRSAIRNSGLEFPLRRITINLAPANTKKEGAGFDLSIAVSILHATGQIECYDIEDYAFIGELSLNGEIKPVSGILPMTISAYKSGIKKVILSNENAEEAAVVQGIEIYPMQYLTDVVGFLNGEIKAMPYFKNIDELFEINYFHDEDFSDVKGQYNVKRALEVAASGGHNVVMIGSAGSGKTMIAKRLPTILPKMTFEEALEVTKIYSVAGLLPLKQSLITTRPFRSPHHSTSDIALIGGGRIPKPGEISLAHYGVLFLDEILEFQRNVIEVMRQPLEDGVVTISRVNATLSYPARCMLIASLNPCKCGHYPSDECTCNPQEVKQYLKKLSTPLLDRIDIHIEVAPVNYKDLEKTEASETSEQIRERVNKARKIQLERYKNLGIFSNAQLSSKQITQFCKLGQQEKELLKGAFEKLGLSARAYSRILKVARTIADLEGEEDIKVSHLAEAIQYRSLDRKFWN